ncbi:unnamed protein product [Chrysoparadoxa australica]
MFQLGAIQGAGGGTARERNHTLAGDEEDKGWGVMYEMATLHTNGSEPDLLRERSGSNSSMVRGASASSKAGLMGTGRVAGLGNESQGAGSRRRSSASSMRSGRSYSALGGGEPRKWYIVNPENWFDYVGDVLTLYAAIALPLLVSFQHIERMHMSDWYACNIVFDALFMVDFALHFITAYRDRLGRIVWSQRLIVKRYLGGLCALDLIASVPVTLIIGSSVYSVANKVTRLARLPKTVEVLQLVKVLGESSGKHHQKNILFGAYGILRVCLYLFIVLHWVACGWHFLADIEAAESSWIAKDGLEGAGAGSLYVTSLYWAVTTLSTVGYGDIQASTLNERVYCIIVMLCGATLYALAIGAVSHIVAVFVIRRSSANGIKAYAEALVRQHGLPDDLAHELRCSIDLSGESEAASERHSQETLALLPLKVRTRVLSYMYSKPLSKVQFLADLADKHPVFVTSFALLLKEHYYPESGDIIMLEGGLSLEMFFLVSGSAIVSRRGTQVAELSGGCHFGEVGAMLLCPRPFTVTARETCEIYSISTQDLHKLCRQFPEPMSHLRRAAMDTLISMGLKDAPVVADAVSEQLEVIETKLAALNEKVDYLARRSTPTRYI